MEIGKEYSFEPAFIQRGRKPDGSKRASKQEYKRREREKKREEQLEYIAILDMETDPFDAPNNGSVFPFLAVLYADNFDPIIIWDENHEAFISALTNAIEQLPGRYTIYAHNGGKFDYMFLVHRLRGSVMFKGRGIMSAKIGNHEIRDSFHIIPERLAGFHKEVFDYDNMRKGKRSKHKRAIIDYCISDCRYLLEIVKKFVGEQGLKISIGQAAMHHLRKEYKVEKIGDVMDSHLRQFFFGGRVECLQGRGHWKGAFKLYDVNSMYPYVMATYQHPIGNLYTWNAGGKIGPNCVFLELVCDNNGALVRRGENNETSGQFPDGRFMTTIWEYRVAIKYGLIKNVKILRTVDCDKRSDFSRVIRPMYDKRIITKSHMKALVKQGMKDTHEYNEAKKDDMILKFLLNNMYGKFAQNPRRYKEHYITDVDTAPPDDWFDPPGMNDEMKALIPQLPNYECDDYWIWERPNPGTRFNNVGTAASITGAARAVLLEAIQLARDPIYCDTDSLICKELSGVEIDGTALGAWDIETEFDEVIVTGKKQYACKVKGVADGHKDRDKIRSKGVSDRVWNDFVRMLDGEIIEVVNRAPTMTKTGAQFYMRRKIKATAPIIPKSSNKYRERVKA